VPIQWNRQSKNDHACVYSVHLRVYTIQCIHVCIYVHTLYSIHMCSLMCIQCTHMYTFLHLCVSEDIISRSNLHSSAYNKLCSTHEKERKFYYLLVSRVRLVDRKEVHLARRFSALNTSIMPFTVIRKKF